MEYRAYVEQRSFRRASGGTPDTTLNPYKTMNADQFVEKIQELRQLSPDDPTSRRLIITKKSAVSPLFDDPLLDLLHRYDVSNLSISIICFGNGIFEMVDMDDEYNAMFNKSYYFLGAFNEGWFVITKATQEVLNVAEDDILIEHDDTCSYIAKDGTAFLDTFYLHAVYFIGDDKKYSQDSLNSHIRDITESSGGHKYAEFWIYYVLASLAEYYTLTLPEAYPKMIGR